MIPAAPTPEPLARLDVDDERVWLPADADEDATYDLVVNGQHVWSVQPRRDATGVGRGRGVAWPAALRRRLRGHAVVELREHLSGRVLGQADHVFDDEPDAEVRVTDAEGHPLVIDKWGALVRPLSGESAGLLDELLDRVEELLRALSLDIGLPSFICYGTLLGAVRNGRLIGHDNDIDLAYASAFHHPVDVNREGMRVQRALALAGWQVRRGSGTRLNVVVTLSDGSVRYVDVFSACWIEGILYIPSDTGFEVPESMVLPLTEVGLEGRQLPAPARSEALLELTYGPRWREPDPSFRYLTPPWLTRRFSGWFGGLVTHRKHWDGFAARADRVVPEDPSPFALWVSHHYPATTPLVDLGAGTGRDSFHFASLGREVTAVDYSPSALARAVRRHAAAAAETGSPAPSVAPVVLNFYDSRAALALGTRLAHQDASCDLYARFLLHSLNETGRDHVLRLAAMSLRRGGHLFLEFRTGRDRPRPRRFKHGARYFLEVQRVMAAVERHGGRIVHQERGTGLARFGDEDPDVCRMVVRWDRDTGRDTGHGD